MGKRFGGRSETWIAAAKGVNLEWIIDMNEGKRTWR